MSTETSTEEKKVQNPDSNWEDWGWEGSTDLNPDTEVETKKVQEFIDITAKSPKEEQKKEVDLFAEETTDDDKEEQQPSSTETKDVVTDVDTSTDDEEPELYNTLAKELKTKGVFQNVEIKDDEEITEDRFFELQDEEIEARADEAISSFFEDMDEEGKAFLKFKKNGGSTKDFMQIYGNNLSMENLNLEDESDQERMVRYYLKVQDGEDSEVIEDKIAWLKENKKLSSHAKKYDEKLKAIDDANRKELLKRQEEADSKREENSKNFKNTLVKELETKEKIKDFKFSKEDKSLVDYLLKPTAKVGNRFIPQFNVALSEILKGETPESREKLLLLAKLVKTDFNIAKDIEILAETKVAKKAKSGLSNFVNPNVSGSKPSREKSLADIFS